MAPFVKPTGDKALNAMLYIARLNHIVWIKNLLPIVITSFARIIAPKHVLIPHQ